MKKFLPLKTIFLGIVMIAGIFIKGWPGGFVCGLFFALLIFDTVGKIAFEKSMKRVEKRIADEKINL